MNKLLIACFTLAICASLYAAQGFSTLEEQMTGKEFTAAGLDKLSGQELAALNAWIQSRTPEALAAASAGAASTTLVTTEDRRGFDDDEDRKQINSRIVGRFNGWDGETVFKLENGMIWEQVDDDKFYVKEIENPVVIIDPSMFGRWHLSIEGHDSECRVKRIQ
jgi:hypothetical protein